MAYRFAPEQTVPANVARCAAEQLQRGIDRLQSGIRSDPVAAVHDARKAIKKVRSLLRLAAPVLDRDQRQRENAELRVMAHALGSSREGDALVATMDGIATRYSGRLPQATLDLVGARLRCERDRARAELRSADVPAQVTEELRAALARVDQWRFRSDDWSAITDRLSRSYRRGRRAMRTARRSSAPEPLHEWRKRTKDLWYQLRLLSPLAPGTVGGAAKDAHRLADVLGDLHDLALVDSAMRRLQSEISADLYPLHGLIDHRAAQLRDEAFGLGDRVYAERPKAFAKRMRRYLKAWRSAFQASLDEHPAELADATRHRTAA